MNDKLERIKVDTFIEPDARNRIIQDIDFLGEIQRRVLDASEEGVRKALIQLGWTPPGELKCSRCGSPIKTYMECGGCS